jgi:hypothetical protein
MEDYAWLCIRVRIGNALISADEHAQASGSEHGDRHSPGPPGPQTAQKQYAGSLEVDAQPSAARISLPGARRGRFPPRCVELAFRTPPRHRAPGPGTWKDPDPRRRSSRGSEGPEQACLPGKGGYATPAGCPVSTTSRRYDLRRTCRLVTAGHIDLDPHSQTRPRYRSPQSGTAINGHVVFGSSNFRSPNRDAWLPWLSPLVSARRSFVYGRL